MLAAAGLVQGLSAFIEVAGPQLDFLRRTKSGANALQLAKKKSAEAAQVRAGPLAGHAHSCFCSYPDAGKIRFLPAQLGCWDGVCNASIACTHLICFTDALFRAYEHAGAGYGDGGGREGSAGRAVA